jgi:peptidoglycan/xylan/chitin deacetylase (PgdA/CDA1 family)
MYHSISDRSYAERNSFYQTHTTQETFKTHMSILHEDGYRVTSLVEALSMLKKGSETGKTAVITFDDGYSDFMEAAWPVMRRFEFPATIFVSTGFVGRSIEMLPDKTCLSWEQISSLDREGVEIGSHTVTHRRLDNMGRKEIQSEIFDSKQILEDKLGRPISAFSCPYAFPAASGFRKIYVQILQDAGYRAGVTTRIGRAAPSDGPYLLKRLPVNEFDDPDFFRAKVMGHYDWMYGPQELLKKTKTVTGRYRSR